MKVDFYLRYHTNFGQKLAVVGTLPELGEGDDDLAVPMNFLNDEFWHLSVDVDANGVSDFQYRYILVHADGERRKEAEKQRSVDLKKMDQNLVLIDTWNDESLFENAFYTAPFTEVFFRDHKKAKSKKTHDFTHQFRVKAPLLAADEAVCLLGSGEVLHQWDAADPIRLHRKGDWWTANPFHRSPSRALKARSRFFRGTPRW